MDVVGGLYSEYESQEDLNSEGFEYSLADDGASDSDGSDSSDGSGTSSGGQDNDNKTAPNSLKQKSQPKLSKKELAEYYNLLSHIRQLNDELKEKEKSLEGTRNKLSQCREDIQDLNKTLEQNRLILKDSDINIPIADLTSHRIEKIEKELSLKKKEEDDLKQLIHQQELAISEVQLFLSQYDCIQPILQERDNILKQQKSKQAMLRVQTQSRQVIEAQRMESMKEKEKEKDLRAKSIAATAKEESHVEQSHHHHKKFLKIKDESSKDKEERERMMEQRIKAVLSLKKSIDSSRSSLQAQQLLVKEREKKLNDEEMREREKILEEGGNPYEVLLKRKHLDQLEKDKQNFEQEQKKRQLEIVRKLVEETKKQDKKRLTGKPPLKQSVSSTKVKKTREEEGLKEKELNKEEITTEPIIDHTNVNTTDDDIIPKLSEKSVLGPEIPGLWETQTGEDRAQNKKTKQTKMGQSINDRILKSNVTITQSVSGKEFKGQAFASKPEKIVFKDFVVGKFYKKKVQLTNVSFTVNHLKLIGVTENLKDFIRIKFKPPGAMSAGLTCFMTVTFTPKLNDDMTGSIDFISHTGPFSIPVDCITKKCLVSVDDTLVSFGSVYIGEKVKRSIIVCNKGALPAEFTLSLHQPTSPNKLDLQTTKSGDDILSNSAQSKDRLSSPSQKSIISTVEFGTVNEKLHSIGLLEKHTRSLCNLNSLTSSKAKVVEAKKTSDEETLPSPIDKDEVSKEEREYEELEDKEDIDQSDEVAVTQVVSTEFITNTPTEAAQLMKSLPIAITVVEDSSMTLEPYSSCTVDVSFAPEVPGDYESCLKLVTTSDITIEPIYITASGKGIDVPVYLEEEFLDLKICMMDRLYQTSIILHNRSTTPLQVTFFIPPVLQNYINILPKYGVVQSKSSFSAQLKFLPQINILCQGAEFFDEKLLKVPIEISVSGQTTPVFLTVSAVVTESEIDISQTQYDFGKCTILESVVAKVSLTNKSCLPQDYGFVHLPKWISVQPNDGFGTLLPHETVDLDIIFSPDQPQNYSSDITLKSSINKDYKIHCKGIGALPALELSHSSISFAATPINSSSIAHIRVANPRLSRMNSAVIRGFAPSRGPRIFEFCIPPGLPLAISPSVGVVNPGEFLEVEVSFSPVVDPQSVQDAAAKLASIAAAIARKKAEEEAERAAKEEESQQQTKNQKGKKGRSSGSRGASRSSNNKGGGGTGSKGSMGSPTTATVQAQKKIEAEEKTFSSEEGSDIWWEAYNNVLSEYENRIYQCSIPCFISDPIYSSDEDHKQVTQKSDEVIYLDVTAAAVRPSLIVVSDKGRPSIDFGNVAIGDKSSKSFTLKNISSNPLKLCGKTCLNPREGFEMRNALREILPDSTHSILLQFAPETCRKYHETLQISYGISSYLELSLSGQGVNPVINITPNEGPIDWDHILMEDTVTKNVTIENPSEFPVRFFIRLENHMSETKVLANFNGQPFFTCIPHTGTISPGSSIDIDIHCNPDRPNYLFTSSLHIEINDKANLVLPLKGYSTLTNMYALGGDSIGSNQSSMAAVTIKNEDTGAIPSYPLLFTFKHNSFETSAITQLLRIGCVKSGLVKKPKSEYVIEPLQGNDAKYFSIDPMKSSVDAGETKQVSITFNPSIQSNNKRVIQAHTNVILKGEKTIQHYLVLQAVLGTS